MSSHKLRNYPVRSSDLCEFPQIEKLSVKALICVSSHKLRNYP
ncbi:hypothetical protein LEP1GSC166_3309 [Leptospira kirschneri]|nr:hypothetical protein LEP1GSC166_3309 [Leptospira kirschneri]